MISPNKATMGRIVIVAFRPKPGMESDLLQLTRDHMPVLLGQGLVTDRDSIAMRAADGTIVEVFEWKSEEAVQAAHSIPVVLEMWQKYGEACDIVRLVDVAELQQMFPHFEPIEP